MSIQSSLLLGDQQESKMHIPWVRSHRYSDKFPSGYWRFSSKGIQINQSSAKKNKFDHLLMGRRSQRMLHTKMETADLSGLLSISTQIQSVKSGEFLGELTFRPSPSCGARHPLEILVLTRGLHGLEDQLYAWNSMEKKFHSMKLKNNSRVKIQKIAKRAGDLTSEIPALLLLVAVVERTKVRYPDTYLSHIMKDTGAFIQTLYLVAESFGLSACALGLETEKEISKLVGLQVNEEIITAGMALGGGAL